VIPPLQVFEDNQPFKRRCPNIPNVYTTGGTTFFTDRLFLERLYQPLMLIVELENLFFLFPVTQLIISPLQATFRAGINPAPTSLVPRVSPRRRFSPSPRRPAVPSA
jgi:hypothetical protein